MELKLPMFLDTNGNKFFLEIVFVLTCCGFVK